MKFKVGDKIKIPDRECDGKKYCIGIVVNATNDNFIYTEPHGHCLNPQEVINCSLVSEEVNMKNARWGIKFEQDCDPVEFFKTEKDARKRIGELLSNRLIDRNSVYLFEVGKCYKVEIPVDFKLMEV
jgi:hypothetical protein